MLSSSLVIVTAFADMAVCFLLLFCVFYKKKTCVLDLRLLNCLFLGFYNLALQQRVLLEVKVHLPLSVFLRLVTT